MSASYVLQFGARLSASIRVHGKYQMMCNQVTGQMAHLIVYLTIHGKVLFRIGIPVPVLVLLDVVIQRRGSEVVDMERGRIAAVAYGGRTAARLIPNVSAIPYLVPAEVL